MNNKLFFIFLCVCYSCLAQTVAQVHENALPYSASENLPAMTQFKELPAADASICKEVSPQNLIKFACPIVVDFDPAHEGQWTETAGGRVWRLGIRSGKAYSLYLNMHFKLSNGARLYVYGPGYQDLRGAFTSRNNNAAAVLTIAPVRGDRLIVEINLPPSQSAYGSLKINKVYHDYLNIYNDAAVQSRNSNACNQDINCANGSYWQAEKRSVCKILSNGMLGTGTLVGNTSGSNMPYVLTAYHIISSAEAAAETLFFFNDETSGCGEAMAANSRSLSGASLIATTDHQLDFTLLQLHQVPPPSYQPYYAGWDARNLPAQQSSCIHHPFGGAKQIAIDYHPVSSEDIGKGFDANSTWKVSQWEVGTTEQGSSGAPLFNEQHRLVGTLTAGRSTCGYARDDYFTKFAVSWNAYPAPSNQLKNWLDPAQTGKLVLDGYDPWGFNEQYCDTAWNFSPREALGLREAGFAWGWASGHNSAGYEQFAERFEAKGLLQINGAYLKVAKAYASNPLAHIELKVWEGTQYPEEERYSKIIFIKDLQPDKPNYIAFDTVLKSSGPMFIGYKINNQTVSDTFAISQTLNRGYHQATSMYVYDEGWYGANDHNTLGMPSSLGIGISQCYGKAMRPAATVVNVYPNPSSNALRLDIPGGIPIHEVLCFDNSGRVMPVYLSQTEDSNTLNFDLNAGLYSLKIITLEKTYFARFMVIQ